MPEHAAPAGTRYAAFLRGVNIGGHKAVGMQPLKAAFGEMGFDGVSTILASGNVLFRAPRTAPAELTAGIEGKLRDAFGFEIPVMVRTVAHLQGLAEADPFREIEVTPQTRLLVTFLAKKPGSHFPLPYVSPRKEFRILSVSAGEVLSALTVTPGAGTPEFMKFMDREFGRALTTRTWTTVLRMLRA